MSPLVTMQLFNLLGVQIKYMSSTWEVLPTWTPPWGRTRAAGNRVAGRPPRTAAGVCSPRPGWPAAWSRSPFSAASAPTQASACRGCPWPAPIPSVARGMGPWWSVRRASAPWWSAGPPRPGRSGWWGCRPCSRCCSSPRLAHLLDKINWCCNIIAIHLFYKCGFKWKYKVAKILFNCCMLLVIHEIVLANLRLYWSMIHKMYFQAVFKRINKN